MDLPAHERRVFGRPALAVALAALVMLGAGLGRADAPAKTFPALPASMQVPELAGWLRANTDIPPASLVSLVRGVATVLADRGAPDGAVGRRTNVVVRREALSDAASEVIGGRSELVSLEIDCNASQYRLSSREVHPGNGLTGPAHAGAPGAAMAAVPPNTDLAFLLRAVCDPTYQPPLAPYLGVAAAPATAVTAARPQTQPANAQPQPANPQPQAVTTQPRTLAQPPAPAAQPPAPPAQPPTVVAQAPPPVPTQQQAANPQPPAVAARPQTVQPPAPPAHSQAANERPRVQTGRFVAQVSASASEALARKLIAEVTRRLPEVASMPTSIERVKVKDSVLFRVSIGGFPTSGAAEAFCGRLRAASFPCWVR